MPLSFLARRKPAAVRLLTLWLGAGLSNAALALPFAAESLDHRIEAAASYLHAQVDEQGLMVYRRNVSTGKIAQGRYNVLRHAGSLLALAEYHQEHPPDAAQTNAIERAFGFLRHCCLAPAGKGAEGLAVWSPPELVGGRRQYAVAKLGGAGLTLAAMAQWRRLKPEAVRLVEMQELGRFIVSMQAGDGRFRSLHAHASGQHDPAWVSLYYPGEAALGLILLYEHDGDVRWLEAAIDALRALARDRENQTTPPPDHWALLATARLWRQEQRQLDAALPEGFSWQPAEGRIALAPLLLAHGQAVARVMLSDQKSPKELSCAQGGFTPDGRSTPTATRLEGLLGLLTVLPEGADRSMIQTGVEAGMAFLLDAQYVNGVFTGAFARVSSACPANDPRAHEVRIDYVQHALSAMQAYRTLRLSSNSP